MRVIVMGYHNVGYFCLEELLAAGAEVVAVVTHEDNPGEEIWFRSVRELAEKNGLPVFMPGDVNAPEFVAKLRVLKPDFIFSFYFRSMLKQEILDIPSRGAINLHGSFLPKYRGRCPANWAILNGETETGVTLHYMVTKPDAGDIIARKTVSISDDDTAQTLNEKLATAARELMRETWPSLREGTAQRIPQNHAEATYYGGRKPEDGRIDWNKPAREIHNLVRAVTHPYPGAFTLAGDKKIFVWKTELAEGNFVRGSLSFDGEHLLVGTGEGNICILSVSVENGPEMSGADFFEKYNDFRQFL